MESSGRPSFHELSWTQLDSLWSAIHRRSPPPNVRRILEILVPPELERTTWPSFVSDDHTPYEYSLLVGPSSVDIRLMSEPLPHAGPVTLAGTMAAAARARRTLESELGVDFTRFDRIADLFLPQDLCGPFAVWYAVSFAPDGAPSFKVYLNPLVHGLRAAPHLLEEALDRLGVRGAWSTITRAMPRGPELDEMRFFSLDLGADESARVKVYGFHHGATIDDLTRTLAVVPDADLDAARRFCRLLVEGEGELRATRQPGTCLAFVGDSALPKTGTLHIPIRAFATDDAMAHKRVSLAMSEVGLPTATFDAALEGYAQRPLDQGSGLIAWAALRTGAGGLKSNVYLAPKAVSDEPTRAQVRPTPKMDAPEVVVRRFEAGSVATHPFLARLAREPFDATSIALLVLNVREAITQHFARRLANVAARVEEDELRSILTKQLNDELGNGDPNRTHKLLFERFADGIAPWAAGLNTPLLLEPGRVFGEVQEELYIRRSPYEGLGATLIMEVLGKQGDIVLGQQLRRRSEPLSPMVMEWLVLHEELEIDHVEESFELARRIPEGNKARLAARGAEELGHASWAFLDGMYRVCFARA
jgi:DMATS type aromatic prenyltransferase